MLFQDLVKFVEIILKLITPIKFCACSASKWDVALRKCCLLNARWLKVFSQSQISPTLSFMCLKELSGRFAVKLFNSIRSTKRGLSRKGFLFLYRLSQLGNYTVESTANIWKLEVMLFLLKCHWPAWWYDEREAGMLVVSAPKIPQNKDFSLY